MGREILDRPAPPAHERIAYGELPQQFGELRLPNGAGPHPLALLLHGGFWRAAFDLKHMGHLGAALAKEGVASFNAEYRKIGEPGGGYPGILDDVRLAAGLLPRLGKRIDSRRAVVVGFSAGGQLALWLGNEEVHEFRGVVSLAGVADLERAWEMGLSNRVVDDFLGGSPQQVPERYRHASPASRLPVKVRQRLLHGVEDDVVPVEIARGYARRAGGRVHLREIPGAGHFEPIDPHSTAWPLVRDTILELLS